MSLLHLYKHLRKLHGIEHGGNNVLRHAPTKISPISLNVNGQNICPHFVRAFCPTLLHIWRRLRRIQVATATTAPRITICSDAASDRANLVADIVVPDDIITPMFTAIQDFDTRCFSCATAIYTDGIMTNIAVNSIVYNFERYISRGGYGQVYEVKAGHTSLPSMACKIVPIVPGAGASQEIAIHKQLHHENIVQMWSSFQDDLSAVLLMDVFPESLADFAARKVFADFDECRFLMRQVLNGTSYLHQNNVIHRDLKLSNILLSQNQQVKICDFGIAIRQDAPASELSQNLGTMPFTSPEVISQTGATFASDIWSIGVIAYRLFKGYRPFDWPEENPNVNRIHKRILRAEFSISSHDEPHFVEFMRSTLVLEPNRRLTAENCLKLEIFKGPNFRQTNLPRNGEVEVMITHVLSPEKVYVQQLNSHSDFQKFHTALQRIHLKKIQIIGISAFIHFYPPLKRLIYALFTLFHTVLSFSKYPKNQFKTVLFC